MSVDLLNSMSVLHLTQGVWSLLTCSHLFCWRNHATPGTVCVLMLLLLCCDSPAGRLQLSRSRKSATAAELSHRSCTVSWVGWLWQLNRCSTECGVTNIWYATHDVGLVSVQKPTVTRMQLGDSGTDWPRQQTFKWWDIRWWSSKDSVWYKSHFCSYNCLTVEST